jgi:hypothetical protein
MTARSPSPRVLVVHRNTLFCDAIAVVLAACPGVTEVTCANSAAGTLRSANQRRFGAALVDLGLPTAEVESLVGAFPGSGAQVVGLAGTDAEAAAGRRAGVDAVWRVERPLAALLAELLPEVGSLSATAPVDGAAENYPQRGDPDGRVVDA